MQGSYEGGSYSYDRTVGDIKDSGSVKASGSVIFDNNQFQQVLRSLTTFSSLSNLSFTLPLVSATEVTTASLTASKSSVDNVKVPYSEDIEAYKENGIPCYKISITRSTAVNGTGQTLFYSTEDIVCNGWKVKNPLVKMIEPYKNKADGKEYSMEYTLKTVTIS